MSTPSVDPRIEGRIEAARQKGLDEFLDVILEEGLRLVGTDQGSLMLVNAREGVLEIMKRRGPEYDPKRKYRKFALGQGIAGQVAGRCKHRVTGNVKRERDFARPLGKLNFLSLLAVPIIRRQKAVGVICADSPGENKFTSEDAARLEGLADRVASAFDELAVETFIVHAKRLKALETLHSVGQNLTRATFEAPEQLSNTLQEIGRDAEAVLGADIVTLYQYDQKMDHFHTPPTLSGRFRHRELMNGPIFAGDIPRKVLESGEVRFVDDARKEAILTPRREERPEPEAGREPFVRREEVVSSAGIPLNAGDEIVGVMFVNYRILHAFSEDDRYMIELFAASAALAIQGARLVRETIQARDEEARREAMAMRTRQEMAAIAVHNLNNPAVGVRTALENIHRFVAQGSLTDEEKEKIQRSVENGLEQVKMILNTRNTFLTYIRPQRGETMKEIDLVDLVERCRSDCVPEDREIKFCCEETADLRRVCTYPVALQTALTSLLQNALEATRSVPEPMICVDVRLGDEAGEVDVADNGPGVSPEIVQRMFDAFSTTKGYGTGLGLFAARKVMQEVGGNVLFDDSYHPGARFRIEFPFRKGESK